MSGCRGVPSTQSERSEALKKEVNHLVADVIKMADNGVSFIDLITVQERLAYLWVLHGTMAGYVAGMEGDTTKSRCAVHMRKADDWRKDFDETIATDPDGISPIALGGWLVGKAWALGHIALHEKEADTVWTRIQKAKEADARRRKNERDNRRIDNEVEGIGGYCKIEC